MSTPEMTSDQKGNLLSQTSSMLCCTSVKRMTHIYVFYLLKYDVLFIQSLSAGV